MVEEIKTDEQPLLTYVRSFLEVNDMVKQRIYREKAEVKQIIEQQAPDTLQ